MPTRILAIATAVALSTAAASASAQASDEAVLFNAALFKGAQLRISGPTQSIPAFVVKSLQVPPNTAWELCTGNTFTHCQRFSESKRGMVMTVRSARPVAPPISATAAISSAQMNGQSPSLRGLESEFFVLPQADGNRIEVAKDGGATSERATAFCRSKGWRTSAYQREQAIDGHVYLADVLCSDQAR